MDQNVKSPWTEWKGRRGVLAAYDIIGILVVALVSFVLIVGFLFRVVGVDGDSMNPTLCNGDRLLLSSRVSKFERGDIVVIDRYTDKPLIKRVIGVGGDKISILYLNDKSAVMVNGQIQYENYIQGVTVPNDYKGEITIPQGYYFVMGDNRTISKDSRLDEVGLIHEKDIVGKAQYCVWPPSSFGSIYDPAEP